MITNGDPEGRIFLSYPHTNNGFFFSCDDMYMPLPLSFDEEFDGTGAL